jgi:hypothetical protein
MGGRAEGQPYSDPGESTPIGGSGIWTKITSTALKKCCCFKCSLKYLFLFVCTSNDFCRSCTIHRTGPVSNLDWTAFMCYCVCGCMIIGRAQKCRPVIGYNISTQLVYLKLGRADNCPASRDVCTNITKMNRLTEGFCTFCTTSQLAPLYKCTSVHWSIFLQCLLMFRMRSACI